MGPSAPTRGMRDVVGVGIGVVGVPGHDLSPPSCPSFSLLFGSGFRSLHTRTSPAPIYKVRSITTPVHRLGSLAIVITFRSCSNVFECRRIWGRVFYTFPAHSFPHSPCSGGPETAKHTPMGGRHGCRSIEVHEPAHFPPCAAGYGRVCASVGLLRSGFPIFNREGDVECKWVCVA